MTALLPRRASAEISDHRPVPIRLTAPALPVSRDELLQLPTVVPVEGVHKSVPDQVYHGAGASSLSSSGARRLIWSGITPRQFRYEQLRGAPDTDTFEFGRAVHSLALGAGPMVVRLGGFSDWKTKRAQQLRAHHRRAGNIPLLPPKFAQAEDMAAAVREHPAIAPLLAPGFQEVSIYWVDRGTRVMLRARPDWLHPTADGAVVVVDLKTADSANPEDFAWAALRYGYHLQQDWYTRALHAFDWPVRAFLFAVVSKHAPYVVSVCEFDPADIRDAARHNRRAIDLYADYRARNHWPAHGSGIHRLHLPRRANVRYHP